MEAGIGTNKLIAKINKIVCQKQQIYTSLHPSAFMEKWFKYYQSGLLF